MPMPRLQSLTYNYRLLRSAFWQRPQRYHAPTDARLTQQIFVVTGGNAGLGAETVRALALHGAEVIIGSRSLSKAEQAVHAFEQDAGQVNNAGMTSDFYATSKQGHEMHFAVNHLGHFLLTQLLLPNLQSPDGRVVFVNGELHLLAEEATPDFVFKDGFQNGVPAYCRSKLAGIWFAYELQRRNPDLIVPVLHPGVVQTNLFHESRFVDVVKSLFFVSAEQGAQTTLHCCLADDVKGLTYYHNVFGEIKSADVSYNEDKAAAMWILSEQLTESFR